MDSLAMMLEVIELYGTENIISLGFDYGQRHFTMENNAATIFCAKHNIPRRVLKIGLDQIGGCSLVDSNIPVTTDMKQQRSTVVPMRNSIFLMYAAAFAQVTDCDMIFHGACAEDYSAYRDCRPTYFRLMEAAIQAGITQPKIGLENVEDDMYVNLNKSGVYGYNKFCLPQRLDITIQTPLINQTKAETMKRILSKYPVSIYEDSYTCYNGNDLSCSKCPACVERLNAFKENNVTDPIKYVEIV